MHGARAGGDRLLVLVLTCRISPPERVASCLAQLAGYGDLLRVEVVDGMVDGDPEAVALHDRRRERRWTKRALTAREVATYGTHRRGWQRLVDSGAGHALLLEDDAVLTDPAGFRRFVAALPEAMGGDVDVLKLFDYPDSHDGGWVLQREVAGEVLLLPARPRPGTVGYVLAGRAARRLLTRRRVFRAVDEDLRHYWEFGLAVWSRSRPLVADGAVALGGSLLEGGRQAERGNRSLARSLRGLRLNLHYKLRRGLAFAGLWLRTAGVRLRRL